MADVTILSKEQVEHLKNSSSTPFNVTVKTLQELVQSGKPLSEEEPDWFKIDMAQVGMKIAASGGLDSKSFEEAYEKPTPIAEPWVVPDWN